MYRNCTILCRKQHFFYQKSVVTRCCSRESSSPQDNSPLGHPQASAKEGLPEKSFPAVLPTQTPVSGKIESQPAAEEDLADALWARLLGQNQQTINGPPDIADQVIRNVFPTEAQPIADDTPTPQPKSDGLNSENQNNSDAVQPTTKLVREFGIAKDTKAIANGPRKLTAEIGDLRAAGMKDAHHVIQDAAVKHLPGYDSNRARGIQLPGPATTKGTRHNIATTFNVRPEAERMLLNDALDTKHYVRQDALRQMPDRY